MTNWLRKSLSKRLASDGGGSAKQQQNQDAAAATPTTLTYTAPLDCLALEQGPCPSGTLTVEFRTSTPCPGYGCSVLALIYKIPSGVQHNYHPHPGVPYDGTHRIAYLPDNAEGRQLLTRYQITWLLGRCLDVGYSMARKKDHQVRWTDSVPHKTSLAGGSFGFPDDAFLSKANAAFDKIRIPPANQCEKMLTYWGSTRNDVLIKYIFQVMHLPKPLTLAAGPSTVQREVVSYEAPLSFSRGVQPISKTLQNRIEASNIQHNDNTLCLICLQPLVVAAVGAHQRKQQALMQTEPCQHNFHSACIMNHLQQNTHCPACQTAMQGKGPSGTMSIRLNDRVCPGFDKDIKTIELCYDIPSGTQADYHETPGMRFDGAQRTAYLPNNEAGRDLLQRLKYAFQHGFTFRIGTSLTSGLQHQTTWTTIPHKTSLSGGEFGFPDNDYITKCNQALDALNIPAIREHCCLDLGGLGVNQNELSVDSGIEPLEPLSPGPVSGPNKHTAINPADMSSVAPVIPPAVRVPKHLAPAVAIPLDAVNPIDIGPIALVPYKPPPPNAPLAPSPSDILPSSTNGMATFSHDYSSTGSATTLEPAMLESDQPSLSASQSLLTNEPAPIKTTAVSSQNTCTNSVSSLVSADDFNVPATSDASLFGTDDSGPSCHKTQPENDHNKPVITKADSSSSDDYVPRDDNILPLVLLLPSSDNGSMRAIQFSFHLVVDDVVQVARDLVQRHCISSEYLLDMTESISHLSSRARLRQDAD